MTNCPKCDTEVEAVAEQPWPYSCTGCGAAFKALAIEGNIFKVHQDDVLREKIVRGDVMYIINSVSGTLSTQGVRI